VLKGKDNRTKECLEETNIRTEKRKLKEKENREKNLLKKPKFEKKKSVKG